MCRVCCGILVQPQRVMFTCRKSGKRQATVDSIDQELRKKVREKSKKGGLKKFATKPEPTMSVRGENMVDLVGIEPTTSSMPWKRAPSCATGPHWWETGIPAASILPQHAGLVKLRGSAGSSYFLPFDLALRYTNRKGRA